MESHSYTHVAYYPDRRDDAVFFDHTTVGQFEAAVERAMSAHPGIGVPRVVSVSDFEDPETTARAMVALSLEKKPRAGWTFDPAQRRPLAVLLRECVERAYGLSGSARAAAVVDEACRKAADRDVAAVTAAFDAIEGALGPARTAAPREEIAAPTVPVPADDRLASAPAPARSRVSESHLRRAREHGQKVGVGEAAEQLAECVLAEGREDLVLSAGDLARSLTLDGAVRLAGYRLGAGAIRGLLARIDAGHAARYLFGLRDRIAENAELCKAGEGDAAALREAMREDKAQIADVINKELRRARDVLVKLRVRKATGDAYCAVSPSYSPADAPSVVGDLIAALPPDARGTWSYDPESTRWEIRASVWTPTPAAQHAVGEPFEGYVSVQGRDDGRGKVQGGGGILILSCTNGATYCASSSEVSRRHVGAVLPDVERMVAKSTAAIDSLCAAWGRAREQVVELPEEGGAPIPLEVALPGFWLGELLDRRSELHAVLPGRSAQHVAPLTATYFEQRRDPDRLVRADMAQSWTRYVQRFPSDVRRDAEAAAAAWVVSGRRVSFEGRAVAT